MTTYTAISGTETQSGKPLTESLLTRLANNCLAIQEGDATAPKIKNLAFDDGEMTVIDSSYTTGTSASITFNHGESDSRDVYISFGAGAYLNNGQDGTATLQVNGSTRVTAGARGASGRECFSGGRVSSLGSGDHTINVTLANTDSSRHIYLQAMVLKK